MRPIDAAGVSAGLDTMAEDFEVENAADGAKASELGRQIKVEFSDRHVHLNGPFDVK